MRDDAVPRGIRSFLRVKGLPKEIDQLGQILDEQMRRDDKRSGCGSIARWLTKVFGPNENRELDGRRHTKYRLIVVYAFPAKSLRVIYDDRG